ncbi:MAG: potassium channel family protein, partial [Bacteroidetes bacterium]|nr:potassium channel family protein [Bacteroidota bacterium]
KEPADVLEKIYYAAFTLSTLGVGDFTATTDHWRILTGIGAFSGLIFFTASITYFVPVLSAVGHQTKFCLYLHSMGKSPQQLLVNSWNGTDFSLFFEKATDLCQMLIQHSLNHHAYPVIHYFHNTSPSLSVAPSVVMLNETVQLLRTVVAEKAANDPLALTMLQSTLDQYLRVVKDDYMEIDAHEDEMPRPNLDALIQAGIPLREGTFTDAHVLKPFLQRRKLLTNLLVKDGWTWQDVYMD